VRRSILVIVPAFLATWAVLGTVGTARAAAQDWHLEVGLRGGFVRLKPAGTGRADQVDLLDLPGGDYLGQVQAQTGLFVTVPVAGPFALEPSLSLQQNTPTLIVGTMFLAGLRANVALPAGFFAGAGALVRYRDATKAAMQPGVQAALGWRVQVLGPVSLRAEAQFNAYKRTSQTFPYDAYAVAVGVSTRLDDPPPKPAARRRPRPDWEPMVGLAGGYSRLHQIGGTDFAVFSLPGAGTGSLAGVFAPGTSPFFFVLPLTGPLALEVGSDAHRAQSNGPRTVFSGQVSPRLDWALGPHWYVAAGERTHVVAGTGRPVVAVPGAALAAGYRIDITPDVMARTELSYAVDRGRLDFGLNPVNTLGLSFGLMVAPLR